MSETTSETITASVSYLQGRWQEADWYRALTLNERLALLRTTPFPPTLDALEAEALARAQQRLQRWKELPALSEEEGRFAARLALDGLDEEELLLLLGEPAEVLRARCPTPPTWLLALSEAFSPTAGPHDNGEEAETVCSSPLPGLEEGSHTRSFLHPFLPLIRRARRKLAAGLRELARRSLSFSFDAERVLDLLARNIPGLLLPSISRAIVLELHVARVQGRLQGATSEERFQYFLEQLSEREATLDFLQEYVVLARLVTETLERWVCRSLELLERLTDDWPLICATFLTNGEAGSLCEIHQGAGDLHRNGQSVILLRWDSGFRLVYKPRSLAIDRHFQELLAWMNERGFSPPLRTLTVLDRGHYGWVEFVQARHCSSREEIERFYLRQGAYLALLYALEASDFHAENIIAAGEYPMLIDLETLFLPQINPEVLQAQGAPGLEAIGHSVLRVGLLPQRLWSNQEGEGIDMSGLGGQPGQLSPRPVPTWKGTGTDEMRLTNERVELPVKENRPRLNDQDINVLDYSQCIIEGFTRAYRLLMAQRSELLETYLPRFADAEVRCVLRPTRIYTQLLVDSLHPNVLRDALDRDRLFDRLWATTERLPYLVPLIPAERRDLWRGDVPVFTTTAASTDLVTSEGERLSAFFSEPGLDVVRRRLAELSELDLEKQLWIIRASFTSMIDATTPQSYTRLELHPARTSPTLERLLAAASAIGNRLRQFALYQGEYVGWLGVTPVNDREWHLLPADGDLYNGLAGIALFLAYLGHLTGEQRHTELARMALRTIQQQIMRRKYFPRAYGIGAFNGLGSLIYLFCHLGSLWREPVLYRQAAELVPSLLAKVEQDQVYDVIGGAAGAIAALLCLQRVSPSPETLAAAVRCGEHLLSHAQPQAQGGCGWPTTRQPVALAGFAHGNAGIALYLMQLAQVSGETRFAEMARAALAYERTLFSPSRQNWLDLRQRPPSSGASQPVGEKYMVAWCHGAPGVALSRLALLSLLDDQERLTEEIKAGLRTTLTQGFGLNHSLCHGDLGNLDILITAARLLPGETFAEHIPRIAAALLENMEHQGWVCGVPFGVETPGLMTGLAGAGFALLRLASPERVPSVLLLSPPAEHSTPAA
ncbi:MAG: type 2 lantipeptide synthetase LanM family protein [Thermogemmatispora sp.]|uniref:type 2 lanthipeptide synthetase LanM family protein n=1 Tax=Thermogemmatispora sp. TaxID=1968838 RepID=UPI0019FCEFBC|nr:type 2 lanthipeptide synthetase LanM family protein [Thermogemmatispora sp.]MBE3566926.1 type 2 lantipeptide synthetase LanM family protein [Thermogemmatispora sp.]